jgi:triacylglycerol lipase
MVQVNSYIRGMLPVLLVHGIDDTERVFRLMGPWLQEHGFEAHSLNLVPNDGKAGLDELANQLAVFIDSRFSKNKRFDIVAFSMGGLVSRYYLQRLGGVERVDRFISISTPHQGTWTAFLRANAGARQMRPGSEFLKDLANDVANLNRIRVTAIWTPLDLMIVPARSCEPGVGRSIRVNVAVHPLMLRDRRVLEAVRQVLTESA